MVVMCRACVSGERCEACVSAEGVGVDCGTCAVVMDSVSIGR